MSVAIDPMGFVRCFAREIIDGDFTRLCGEHAYGLAHLHYADIRSQIDFSLLHSDIILVYQCSGIMGLPHDSLLRKVTVLRAAAQDDDLPTRGCIECTAAEREALRYGTCLSSIFGNRY